MNIQKYIKKPIDLKWVLVPGRTYSIKDQLKKLGCRFGERTLPDGTNQKGWFHDPISQNKSEIHVLAESLPPEPDRSDWVAITGNTFELKDKLKSEFGARWNADEKVWVVEPAKAKDAQDLVEYVAQEKKVHRTQLWEPCETCGQEPSYATSHGSFCAQHLREVASGKTETRIQALEDEGLTRSDAQGVVLAEDTKERAAQ